MQKSAPSIQRIFLAFNRMGRGKIKLELKDIRHLRNNKHNEQRLSMFREPIN